MVASRESDILAERLIAESIRKHRVDRGRLTLHADRGSSMASKTVAFLLAEHSGVLDRVEPFGDTHDRVRTDRVDKSGKITLRYQGRLNSIGIGRTHARTHVTVLVQDLHVRVIDAATGELLRELVLDPAKRYQGTGRPPGPRR